MMCQQMRPESALHLPLLQSSKWRLLLVLTHHHLGTESDYWQCTAWPADEIECHFGCLVLHDCSIHVKVVLKKQYMRLLVKQMMLSRV